MKSYFIGPNNEIIEMDMPDPPQYPLEGTALVAALNAALGIWDLQDAANIAGVTVDQLVAEVQAWAVAASQEN